MLDTGVVNLNDRNDACVLTGFLPIHAIVANGRLDMFDWMTRELPRELRADGEARTATGRLGYRMSALTPVQLAALLGDHNTVSACAATRGGRPFARASGGELRPCLVD